MEDDSSYDHPWSDVPERLRAVQTPLTRSGLKYVYRNLSAERLSTKEKRTKEKTRKNAMLP